jgi:hypothetical protein
MKTFSVKTVLIIFSAIIFLYTNANCQPAEKAMERIEQLKKVKLLDYLKLDEQASDKFLSKYNAYESKILEKKKALDKANDDLRESIKKEAGKDELSKKTQDVLKFQEELSSAVLEKMKGMKSILDEKKYAIFVVFENTFAQELRKRIMKLKDKFDGDEDMPHRKKKR